MQEEEAAFVRSPSPMDVEEQVQASPPHQHGCPRPVRTLQPRSVLQARCRTAHQLTFRPRPPHNPLPPSLLSTIRTRTSLTSQATSLLRLAHQPFALLKSVISLVSRPCVSSRSLRSYPPHRLPPAEGHRGRLLQSPAPCLRECSHLQALHSKLNRMSTSTSPVTSILSGQAETSLSLLLGP